jgi:hypothetical protein
MNEETLWINRAVAAKRRGAYRHHPLALKWSIVEETLQPGASVARVARQHGINTNQFFLWRKAYRKACSPNRGPRYCQLPSRRRWPPIDCRHQAVRPTRVA